MTGSPSDFRDFIIWERESHDTIDFKKIYVDMAADLKAGLMLSQIIYWRLPRKNRSAEDNRLSIERNGRLCLAKSDNEWWQEIRLTDKEARSARLVLEQRGLVTLQFWKYAGRPCTHISLNEDRFMELWEQMKSTPIEEREAGRIEPKIKREKAKKPGSKPTSGNWRKNQPPTPEDVVVEEAHDAVPAPDSEDVEESGLYEKGNVDITERAKSTLPRGQSPHYEKGKVDFTQTDKSYTETPAEIPPETSSEIPAKKSSSDSESESSSPLPDDDDLAAEAEQQKDQQPTPEEPHSPVQVQPAPRGQEAQPLTTLENIPGGGAAGGSAILALVAIPREVLEARPARDPDGLKVLRALMQASNAKRLDHLHTQLELHTQGKRQIPRELYTRLTDEEIELARQAAKADAGIVPSGMSRAGYYALDAIIGEQYTLAELKGEKRPVANEPLGKAYEVAKDRAAPLVEEPPPPSPLTIEEGSRWEHRHQPDKIVTVVSSGGGKVEFHNGEEVLAYQLARDYRRVD